MDFSLLLLVFSLIFTVVSRLLLLYSTIDKTSRLMVKQFSTARDTQRGSQSYMEKRGRREIEVTRKRRGGVKKGERNLASNQFPKCLHSLEHPERFTELHREEKREERVRGDPNEMMLNQKRREQSSQ